MNDKRDGDQEVYRTFQLMTEIESGEAISQRELAGRLGIAVGLVNSYLKNFVAKGWVRIRNYPRNRYAYLLTPKGIAEKSRLAYQHLSYFNNLYTVVRQDYLDLFRMLKQQGFDGVIFCGVDEVAEIAYLSLQEVGISLVDVLDPEKVNQQFFSNKVIDVANIDRCSGAPLVVTSQKREATLLKLLAGAGFQRDRIFTLDRVGR